MGVVVIALGILGLCAYAFKDNKYRGVVIFWGTSAFIALMFAWGRYFVAYRLFYMLPNMDTMRNPIKFLYPFMLGLAVCSSYGFNYIQGLLEQPISKKYKKKK